MKKVDKQKESKKRKQRDDESGMVLESPTAIPETNELESALAKMCENPMIIIVHD
jgi:hypothetical protein